MNLQNKLRTASFPYVGSAGSASKVKTVVVFIIGGFTYEEAAVVHQLNSSLGSQILLGGTATLNSKAFIEQVEQAYPPTQQDQ